MTTSLWSTSGLLLVLLLHLLVGCSPKVNVGPADGSAPIVEPGPVDGGASDAEATDDSGPDPLLGCTKDPGAPAVTVDPGATTDPLGAVAFTLEKALAGFPSASGKLTAAITTEKSTIKCELAEAEAPISVANFVGLARGTRPYFSSKLNVWKVGHFYDGLTWHRVIPGFVIQGGDPLGDGTGGPGYDLPVENHVAEPLGTLAMAAGAAPSGSQFYIVVGKGPASEYNVFGTCTTETAIAIAQVPTTNEKPKVAIHMQKVEIARCP